MLEANPPSEQPEEEDSKTKIKQEVINIFFCHLKYILLTTSFQWCPLSIISLSKASTTVNAQIYLLPCLAYKL